MLYFLFKDLNVCSLIPKMRVASLLVRAKLITALYSASLVIWTMLDQRFNPYNLPLVKRLAHSNLRPITSSRVNAESIISNASFDFSCFLSSSENDMSLQKPWESDFLGFIYNIFSIMSSTFKWRINSCNSMFAISSSSPGSSTGSAPASSVAVPGPPASASAACPLATPAWPSSGAPSRRAGGPRPGPGTSSRAAPGDPPRRRSARGPDRSGRGGSPGR